MDRLEKTLQTEKLVKEIGRRKKSYEGIIEYIREGNNYEMESDETVPKRRGRKQKIPCRLIEW